MRPELSFGPASFEVTSTSALIWLRASSACQVQIEYGTESAFRGATVTPPVEAGSSADNREYWPVRTPTAEQLYRRFSWTPAAEFFVMECRSYRSPQSSAEGPAKTMLGGPQKE
jgi:phosphodiesterase/alkaline phosphatase D-like protein